MICRLNSACGLGNHAAQILPCAGAGLATRIADPLHGVGPGKIVRSSRRSGLAVGLAVDLEQRAAGLLDLVLMLVEALGEPCLALQQRIVLTAPDREIARCLVHGFRSVLANIPKPLDQFAPGIGELTGCLDPSPFETGIAHIGIEKHQPVRHRNQREDKAQRKQQPRIDVGEGIGRGQETMQHLLPDIVA